VLGVAATGKSVRAAQSRAYAAVDKVDWPGGFCRRDIGYLAVKREQQS
jgi:phosphoribosylamine--glycine ligase